MTACFKWGTNRDALKEEQFILELEEHPARSQVFPSAILFSKEICEGKFGDNYWQHSAQYTEKNEILDNRYSWVMQKSAP